MSRAFVREDDIGQDQQPIERPPGPEQNYITSSGLARLRARYEELSRERDRVAAERGLAGEDAMARFDRDLRWLHGRIERAIVVAMGDARTDRIGFGATVTARDENGVDRTVMLVGEDEADVATGRLSWASPLGRALMGAAVGDVVTWRRPAGDLDLEIVRFDYDALA
ncbi:MAG: GreA/GreB family elongation factor [Alphaproteobacteria bacterium]